MPISQPLPQDWLLKTKPCKFYQQGMCQKGEACCFAHSDNDLQSRPNLYKTQFCRAFLRSGACRDGANCKYAHGVQDVRKPTIDDDDEKFCPGIWSRQTTAEASWSRQTTAETSWSRQTTAETSWSRQTTVDSSWNCQGASSSGVMTLDSLPGVMTLDSLPDLDEEQDHFPQRNVGPFASILEPKFENAGGARKSTALPRMRSTQRCRFFLLGMCAKGEACSFSHRDGISDVSTRYSNSAVNMQDDVSHESAGQISLVELSSALLKSAHLMEAFNAGVDNNAGPGSLEKLLISAMPEQYED
jgi:hypothetical protein